MQIIFHVIKVLGASIRTPRQSSTSCEVPTSWWSDLIGICKCQEFNAGSCQLQILTVRTPTIQCKPDTSQECKDHVFKLAYAYKSSPKANSCKHIDPNYSAAENLANTCKDGFFK